MCFVFFCVSALHPSSPITLKNGGGNERFNERNGAIDPPFILMGHRSQSITGLLILLLRGGGEEDRERWGEGEREFGRSAERFATQSMYSWLVLIAPPAL